MLTVNPQCLTYHAAYVVKAIFYSRPSWHERQLMINWFEHLLYSASLKSKKENSRIAAVIAIHRERSIKSRRKATLSEEF